MERTTQYPRGYSLRVETLRALDAVATIPLALVITFSFLQLAGLLAKPISPIVLLAAGFIAGLLALTIFNWNHRRVTLYEDAIEIRSWFSCRKLNRADILGWRGQAGGPRGGYRYIIFPLDKSARKLIVPAFLHTDSQFFAWMDRIPKLDKSDEQVTQSRMQP